MSVMIPQLSWRHSAEVLGPRILQGSIDSTWQENTTNEGPGMSWNRHESSVSGFQALQEPQYTLGMQPPNQEIWKWLRLKNFWTCQFFLWWPGHFFSSTISDDPSCLRANFVAPRWNAIILESATGSGERPPVLSLRVIEESLVCFPLGTNLDGFSRIPQQHLFASHPFLHLASFSALRP